MIKKEERELVLYEYELISLYEWFIKKMCEIKQSFYANKKQGES